LRSPGDPDADLAAHAAQLLVGEGNAWLSGLSRADDDEAAARVVTDRLYAR
jgi:hypothetical protein